MVGSAVVFFEVCYQCTFSTFYMHLHGQFSVRAEECFSDPTLDVRNDRMNACKNIEKVH